MTPLKQTLIRLLARPSAVVAALLPSRRSIRVMRRLNRIILSAPQLLAIAQKIEEQAPCRVLIFGVGHDSLFWHRLNRNGRTVFLEDDEGWLRKVTAKVKNLQAYAVGYDTEQKDWQRYLGNPALLVMDLPLPVTERPWDLILVDGPAGWCDNAPGRMKSIYLAHQLVKPGGDVFVHDCEREVEEAFCERFLGRENLIREIAAPQGLLRHYRILSPGPKRPPTN